MRILFALGILSSFYYMLSIQSEVSPQKPDLKIIPVKHISSIQIAPIPKIRSSDVKVAAKEKSLTDEFWEEQRERWESILYELIDRVDSERAPVILKNYHQERKRRTIEIGRLIKSHASERLWKLEDDLNEFNLKRIFQEHYDAVKADHDAFNESIRYSHPDGIDEIAIEL